MADESLTFATGVESGVKPTSDLEIQIETVVTKRIVAIARWVITVVLSVFLGWLLTTMWQMNEKLHIVVGQEMVRGEIQELLEKRVEALQAENASLRMRLDSVQRARSGGARR